MDWKGISLQFGVILFVQTLFPYFRQLSGDRLVGFRLLHKLGKFCQGIFLLELINCAVAHFLSRRPLNASLFHPTQALLTVIFKTILPLGFHWNGDRQVGE